MKKAQKLFSVLLAVALVFAMAIPAFAADDGSIVICGTTNVAVAGKTFNAYKILDAEFVDEADTSKGVAYTVPEELKEFYADYFTLEAAKASFNAEVAAKITALDADALNAFADAALAAAKTAGITAKSETAGADATTVTINGLALGYYVIEDATEGANGENTAISSVMLDTTDKAAEVTIKADLPSIDKFIDGDNDTDKSASGLVKYNNVAAGDIIPFVITSKVPADMEYYDTYKYIVTDMLQSEMRFNNDIVITIGEKTLVKGVDYTEIAEDFTYNNHPATKIAIEITDLKEYSAGEDITIRYSATATPGVVEQGVQGSKNTVYLEYSNNPQDDESMGKTPEVTTVTYSTFISITKVDANDTSKRLAGAEFEIKGENLNGLAIWEKNAESHYATEEYKGITGEAGLVQYRGLSAGTYEITETIAPEGYNLLAEPITVTITWHAPEDGSTECSWTVETNVENVTIDGHIINFTIANSTGSLLPETGGIGTTIFYIVGGLLVVGAVILLITKKRMSAEASK